MKRITVPTEARVFYMEMALQSLREAQAYLLCAGAVSQAKYTQAVISKVREAKYAERRREAQA